MKLSVRNILRNAFAVITILLAGFVAFLLCSGTHVLAVQSDSMEPLLSRGDAVFIRQTPFEALREGDVICASFPQSDGYFTHRIIRIDTAQQRVYTRGDHNMSDDPMPTEVSHIVGSLWFSVPYIGFLSLWIQNNTVIYFALGAAITLILIRLVLSLRKRARG